MVAGGANEGGFCYLSHRERAALMDAVRRDVEAFPDGSVVEELYGEVCEFLDAHEATPVVGSTEVVERSLNRGVRIARLGPGLHADAVNYRGDGFAGLLQSCLAGWSGI